MKITGLSLGILAMLPAFVLAGPNAGGVLLVHSTNVTYQGVARENNPGAPPNALPPAVPPSSPEPCTYPMTLDVPPDNYIIVVSASDSLVFSNTRVTLSRTDDDTIRINGHPILPLPYPPPPETTYQGAVRDVPMAVALHSSGASPAATQTPPPMATSKSPTLA